jgi:ubiquinone/menaquinone biosynthesis C-methylase UbiE
LLDEIQSLLAGSARNEARTKPNQKSLFFFAAGAGGLTTQITRYKKGRYLMGLFGWFRRAPRSGTPEQEQRQTRQTRWRWVGGRRMLADSLYLFPKDQAEGYRLEHQNYMFKVASGGRIYFARIRQARRILDVACGTGAWAREMADEFKQSEVIGFDIDISLPEAARERILAVGGHFPANFRFFQADALKPFPFEDQYFDYAHAQFISPFIPVARWPDFMQEMVRVTRSAGYVEIRDGEWAISPSPAYSRILEAIKAWLVKRGLHAGAGPLLADYLRQAGLQRVQVREVTVGTGKEAKREQRLLVADLKAVITNLKPVLIAGGYFTEEEYAPLLERARQEMDELGATWHSYAAYGVRL